MFASVPILCLLLVCARPADPCPATDAAWIELSSVPDSLLVPPQFFFDQPTVPVEGIIVCAHGVFFNFHATQDDSLVEYYISFPVPTHEEYVNYIPQDTLLSIRAATQPGYLDDYVDREVAKNTVGLNQLKADLHRLMGTRYAEGKRIDVTDTPMKLRLGFPLTLMWGDESVPFATYPGIYWRRE